MASALPPGPEHDKYTEWARQQGVGIHNVTPARFPGRGLGLVATADIKAGESVVFVPSTALITAQLASAKLKQDLGQVTVHALLAALLTVDSANGTRSWPEWRAVWPSMDDFREGVPLTWSPDLQTLLPPAAKELLDKQARKFEVDWENVCKVLPTTSRDEYLYYWLIINTRTFYYVAPGMKKPRRRDDCMALCPFVDYFNHAASGCEVTYDREGFTVTSDKAYAIGEELYISYGNHMNDFLLVEYGFILDNNQWDEVRLDHLITAKMSKSQQECLRQAGYLGNYVVDREMACHRTQVALRLFVVSLKAWHDFVDGKSSGEKEQANVTKYLIQLVETFEEEIDTTLTGIAAIKEQTPAHAVTRKRWLQTRQILDALISNLAPYYQAISI